MFEAEIARRVEEEQRIQRLIEEEKERDPDALEDEARQKVYKEQMMRKQMNKVENTNTTQDVVRNFKQPAISLGTTVATADTQEITQGDDWKNQPQTKQMSFVAPVRAPTGRPPTMASRPGAPPKGPPPTGGRSSTV
jgi:hypothetical protein